MKDNLTLCNHIQVPELWQCVEEVGKNVVDNGIKVSVTVLKNNCAAMGVIFAYGQ